MKALFISNDPSLFDKESQTRKRMQTYAAAIGDLHILCPAASDQEEADGNLTLHGRRVHKLMIPRVLGAYGNTLIQKYNIEIVSAQDPFEYGLAALLAVKGTPAKLHVQVHTDFLSPWFIKGFSFPSLLNRIRIHIASRVLPKAHGIRVVSERIRKALCAKYGDSLPPITVLPIEVPVSSPEQEQLPPHQFTFALATVGRLEAEKRIEDILDALSIVHHGHPSVGLVVVGDGRCRPALERRAKAHGISSRVLFLGWQEGNALGFVKSAQAYIQASSYEGYGRTLIEAALAGVPIITTDVGIVGEVFIPNENALVSPPGDVRTLAAHIERLLEDNHLRTVLSMAARDAAKAHLAVEGTMAERIARDLARTLETG